MSQPTMRAQALCLFCHPDDEFAIFAEIEAMVEEGRRVVCVYLTDAAHQGQSAERRAAESRAVLGRLGVTTEDVHFPGWERGIGDTRLHQRLADAIEATRALVPPGAPGLRILLPAWEGGHHDHDAAHLVGLVLARECGALQDTFQFSVYHGRGTVGPLFRVLSPIPENGPVIHRRVAWRDRLRYLRCCLSYPSQRKTWMGLFPLVAANYVLVGTQRLQRVDPARVRQPPHGGVLLYERRGFCTWTAFAEATRDIRAVVSGSV